MGADLVMAVTYRTRRPDGRAGPMAGPEPGHRPDSDSDAAPACGDPGRLEWGLPSDLDRHSSHVSDTAELRLVGAGGRPGVTRSLSDRRPRSEVRDWHSVTGSDCQPEWGPSDGHGASVGLGARDSGPVNAASESVTIRRDGPGPAGPVRPG
jgi:hypothetical protein